MPKINPKDIVFTVRNHENCAFWNARQTFHAEEMNEVKESIRTIGLLYQPIVRKYNNSFQLIAGEKRLRSILALIEENASCYNKNTRQFEPAIKVYETLNCEVEIECDDKRASTISVAENLKRRDPSEVDLMQYCIDLVNLKNKDGSRLYNRAEIAEIVGKSEPWVSQTIGLFNLSDRAKTLLAKGVINRTHAVYLLKLDPNKVDEVLTDAENMAQELYENEVNEADKQLKVIESKVEKYRCAADAIELLGGEKAKRKARKSKQMLEKELETALTNKRQTRARGPRITQDLLQEAADKEEGRLLGKSSTVSYKLLRKLYDTLDAQRLEGPIVCPANQLEYSPEHVEICLKLIDMVLGRSVQRTPLGILTEYYKEKKVEGWIEFPDENDLGNNIEEVA
jgi:hypothetical protein